MLNHSNILVIVAMSLAVAAPASAQDVTADTVAATVNGTDITIGHMIVVRDALSEQYDSMSDEVLFQGILDQLVQQTVLAQTIGSPSRAVQIRLENERRALLAGAAMRLAIDRAVTDDALQAAYDEKFASAELSREFNASHILVETEDEAQALLDALETGADFADLAKEKSTGPSASNGGELGWFGVGMMVPSFEEAVVALEIGQISAPVQTQFGWHVIKLNDSRLLAAPSLDEVREDLTEELEQQVIEKTLAELTDAAEIIRPDLSEVDPAILSDTGLVQN
ncbi:MAG: peptidylprolyl isomerase [Paracoccaceae bacterium]